MLDAAAELGTENLLVVPGAVRIPWIKDHEPVALADCDKRASEAVAKMVPRAEKLGVYLNIENIFFNGYLLSPQDMIALRRQLQEQARPRPLRHAATSCCSSTRRTGSPRLGRASSNVHLKEFDKNGTDHSLACFRTLLDGTTDWPAVTGGVRRRSATRAT